MYNWIFLKRTSLFTSFKNHQSIKSLTNNQVKYFLRKNRWNFIAFFIGTSYLLYSYFYVFRKEFSIPTEIIQLCSKMQALMIEKKYQDAVLTRNIVTEAMSKYSVSHSTMNKIRHRLLKLSDDLANLALSLGLFEQAIENFKETIVIFIGLGGSSSSNEILEISLKIAKCYDSMSNKEMADVAFEALDEMISNRKNKNFNDSMLSSYILHEYGLYLRNSNSYTLAIEKIKMAIDILISIVGSQDRKTLILMNDLASCFFESGKTDESLKLMRKTINLCKSRDTFDLKQSFKFNLAMMLLSIISVNSLHKDNGEIFFSYFVDKGILQETQDLLKSVGYSDSSYNPELAIIAREKLKLVYFTP